MTQIDTTRNRFGCIEIAGDGVSNLELALSAAGLDFAVDKRPLYLSDGTKVPDTSAVVRTDSKKILGVVGKRYTPIQNTDAFGVFQEAFDHGLLEVETAGQLGGGQIVWIQARVVGDPMVVTGEDTVRPYVLLANSHDGSIALRAGFTAVRLFCMNQMAAAQKQGSLVSLRHTRNVKLDALRTGIAAGQESLRKVVQSARFLSQHNVPNTDALNTYTRRVFKMDENEPSRMDKPIQELFETGRAADYQPIRGSWWAGYQAITEYLTHYHGRSVDTRVKSLWFGESAKAIGRALDIALDMVT